MPDRVPVAFRVNGREVSLLVASDARLLDVLRDELRLTGAKEGCGKGECGACTVLLDGQAVDSCLTMAWQADGCAIETIEGLAPEGALHPLQEAFIQHGGVQCGICIPGMVLAAKALVDHHPGATRDEIRHGLAGNLCRCTGYTKILDAVEDAARRSPAPASPGRVAGRAPHALRPRSLDEALELLAAHGGELHPVAGGTDVLVKAKDGLADRSALFDVGAIPELRGIREDGASLRIGAAVTHAELAGSPEVARFAPALPQACRLIGGPQIRNRGTLGGNLANASPAGDTLPPLYAADATVEIASIHERREIPIAELFTGPRTTCLARQELIVAVRVPRRDFVRGAFLRLGQRQAQAISKVSVAVAASFRGGRPEWARVALGAVAPTVVRAPAAEAALLEGGPDGLRRACEAVRDEVSPIDDLRSTREYRREMAAVLLERAWRSLSAGE